MKRLPKPTLDPGLIYASCVSGVASPGFIARLNACAGDIATLAQQYEVRAAASELHLFPAAAKADGEQIVFGEVTKDELRSLYDDQMVPRRKPARSYYDQLMMLAPLGKCPYCGFGHVSTLDHVLPKARYPSFSVLPTNLVPACTDCNKSKGSSVLDALNQIPHPYYENECIETEVWLYAQINQTTPATASFEVVAPLQWPLPLAGRVANYMDDLGLFSRFAVEAASELASLSDYLSTLDAPLIYQHLSKVAQLERANRKNSWKAALYEALAASAWYCAEGCRLAQN